MTSSVVLLAATSTVTSHKAAPFGLLVIALLGVGVYFLARSMSKHLKRVPASFDDPWTPTDQSPSGRPATGRGAASGGGPTGPE